MPRGWAPSWAPACAPTAPPIFSREPVLPGTVRDGILITRPALAGQATGELVRAMGLRPVLAPLASVFPIAAPFPASGRVQAVLVTSGNAIPGLPITYRRVPLFAVGDATARLAAAAGFREVRSAAGDAAALAALVQACCLPAGGALVLATGEGQGGGVASLLRQAGFTVLRRVAYAARAVTSLPAAARTALEDGGLHAALFFSAAGAEIFVRLSYGCVAPSVISDVEALAMSPATGAALTPLPWRRIRVASRPNQDELLALLR